MIGGPQGGIILGKAALDRGGPQEPAGPDRPRGQADAGRAGGHAGAVSRRGPGAWRGADAADAPPRVWPTSRPRPSGSPRRFAAAAPGGATAAVVEGFSQMGSGSLPGQDLPTRLVAVPAGGWRRARSPAACGGTPAGLRPRAPGPSAGRSPHAARTARKPSWLPRSAAALHEERTDRSC